LHSLNFPQPGALNRTRNLFAREDIAMKTTPLSKTAMGLCAAFALVAQSTAYASCSSEEAIAKAEQLAAKVAEITQKDPDRAAQLRAELKELSPQTSADELENACAGYDQRLKELEEAGDQIEDSES
jgi:septal ring factor EnvC (AmiA/AmiB activator)